MNNISTSNSRNDEKIAEMLGKIESTESGLVSLRRETTELVNTSRTAIEADHEQKMSTVRGRQQEIIDSITANQRNQNLLRTRYSDLKIVVDANKIITDDLVARVNSTRFVKNNVGLIPRLTSSTNKEFTVIASNNANDAWRVFNISTGYISGIPEYRYWMVDTLLKFIFKLNCLQQREYINSVSRQDQIVSESNHGHYRLKMLMV